ncbi:MAG: bifunctional phosphoribosylaminoimidazolecarboxamide formyltransferase/IMP cyclohydrolase, partial [Sphingomicrobium sp.]
MIDLVPVKRALISLSDKTGLDALATGLAAHGVDIVSTGGTAAELRAHGASPLDISDFTGFPEMMDGRVKTLHPKVHGGLLAVRDNPDHSAAMAAHDIAPIDLVVVNLYPFAQTVARGADRETIVENIDIGGPSMVRSAAKNHAFVAIITDPADYDELLAELDANGGSTSFEFRRRMAAKAFALTASYDGQIAQWFALRDLGQRFAPRSTLSSTLSLELRYGENPHQGAALYIPDGTAASGLAAARRVQGKELSYNNLNDASAALELVSEFRDAGPTVVIVKHANPCGVATRETLVEAWDSALACDSVSAFGGIVATNRPLDAATAAAITRIFTEVVVAPDADDEAKAIFAAKKNLRLLLTGELLDPKRGGQTMAIIAGGILVQDRDNGHVARDDLKCVTKRQPT